VSLIASAVTPTDNVFSGFLIQPITTNTSVVTHLFTLEQKGTVKWARCAAFKQKVLGLHNLRAFAKNEIVANGKNLFEHLTFPPLLQISDSKAIRESKAEGMLTLDPKLTHHSSTERKTAHEILQRRWHSSFQSSWLCSNVPKE
jgi:hypothetical protein